MANSNAFLLEETFRIMRTLCQSVSHSGPQTPDDNDAFEGVTNHFSASVSKARQFCYLLVQEVSTTCTILYGSDIWIMKRAIITELQVSQGSMERYTSGITGIENEIDIETDPRQRRNLSSEIIEVAMSRIPSKH